MTLNKRRIGSLAGKHGQRWSSFSFYGPFLSAAIAQGARDNETVAMVMKKAINDGISLKQIDELILQSYLFLGFPAMIEASRILADLSGRSFRPLRLPRKYSKAQCQSWNLNGVKKMRRIYGSFFENLVGYIHSFSPQILGWMVNDGYGKVLSRPGISFDQRELCIVAILTVTGYQNQLRAHIRGAVNVGLEIELIEDVIENCRFFCTAQNVKDAQRILSRTCAA